jgi:hypothetical protein
MLLIIAIAAFLMVATTGIHAGGMILAVSVIRSHGEHLRQRLPRTNTYWVGGIVLLMFFVTLLEVLVWAATYMVLNAIQGFETALYFSMVSFTTLGYGDIVLQERWRLLASFEAANGIMMFGWTTAIVIAAVRHVYLGEGAKRDAQLQ